MTTQSSVDLVFKIVSTSSKQDEVAKLAKAVVQGGCVGVGTTLETVEYAEQGDMRLLLKVTISEGWNKKQILEQMSQLFKFGFGDVLASFPCGFTTWSFDDEEHKHPDLKWETLGDTDQVVLFKSVEKWLKITQL